MILKTASIAAALVAAGALTFAGCGPKRPETAQVSGRVTYQGKPVVEGRIMFQPEQGRPATASIAADGTYRLTTFEAGDGAVLGRHRVTIESRRITVPNAPKSFADETKAPVGPPKVEWLVPEKYSNRETSPLTADVKPGRNAIDFDIN